MLNHLGLYGTTCLKMREDYLKFGEKVEFMVAVDILLIVNGKVSYIITHVDISAFGLK